MLKLEIGHGVVYTIKHCRSRVKFGIALCIVFDRVLLCVLRNSHGTMSC